MTGIKDYRHIKIKANKLFFDSLDLTELAQKTETPFFLFSQNALESNYLRFVKNFSRGYQPISVYYSVKTNLELAVLKILADLGSDGEIACGHELYLALKAGIPPKKICFDGPCKTDEDLEYAVKQNIHLFNLESFEEAKRLDKVAKKLRKRVKVGLRINPKLSGFRTGWVEKFIQKFGIALEDAFETYRQIARLANLEIWGVHTHIGSQITSVSPYVDTVKVISKLAKQLKETGIKLKEFNLGGGFPSGTLIKTTLPRLVLTQFGINWVRKPPSISEFGQKISTEFAKSMADLRLKPLLAFEPGRSLASSMGILVTKVKTIKNKWLFLDTSMQSIPESLFFAQKEIIPTSGLNRKSQKPFNIAGASLSTSDIFYLNKKMPNLKLGESLVILDAGAYSISKAVPFTIANPPVYLVDKKKKIKLIRRRSSYEDIRAPMYL